MCKTKLIRIFVYIILINAIAVGLCFGVTPPMVAYLYPFNSQLYSTGKLAVDTAGNIYVTDPFLHNVAILTATGTLSRVTSFNGEPLGIAVSDDGKIYIGDNAHENVTVFTQDLEFLYTLGSGNGEVSLPNDIVCESSTGRVYVVDSKMNMIKVYDSSGNFEFSFGTFGTLTGQFSYPTGIAIDTILNRILVADHNNARIQIFDLDGNYLSRFGRYGGEPGRFTRPQGIAVDTAGRIYVTDSYQNTVQVLDYLGNNLGYIGQYGDDTAQLRTPMDTVIDKFGRLLISSAGKKDLEIFGLDNFKDPVPVELSYFKAE